MKINTCELLKSIYELGFHSHLLQTISKFSEEPRLRQSLKKASFTFHLVLPLQKLVVYLKKKILSQFHFYQNECSCTDLTLPCTLI